MKKNTGVFGVATGFVLVAVLGLAPLTASASTSSAEAAPSLGSALCVTTAQGVPFSGGTELAPCADVTATAPTPTPTPTTQPTPTPTPTTKPETPTTDAATPTTKPDPGLFFSKSTERSDKLVLAHWFPPYPISINNASTRAQSTYATTYLTPTGESGKWSPYGRFLSTAPLFRPQRGGDWRLEDAKDDIRAAQTFGLDGFVFDLLGSGDMNNRNWSGALILAQAADELGTGFKVIPMMDKNGSTGKGTPANAAAALAAFANRPSALYIDGEFVISSFKGEGSGTAADVQWWADTLKILQRDHKIDAGWLAGFLDFGKASMFKDLTIGEGSWGGGDDPVTIGRSGNQVATTHARGKLAMSPVGTSAVRRTQGVFDESANTEATRAYWEKAIREDPDMIQMVTWNDYSEGNTYQPSEGAGYGPLTVASWYIEKYKHGSYPQILKDELILTNRNQFAGSAWTSGHTATVKQWDRGQQRTTVRDTVEVLTFLTKPTTVTVTIGGAVQSYQAPAGMFAKTFPLGVGSVSASTARGLAVTSPVTVTRAPLQQDMSYYWAVASRGTAGQRDSMTP